MFEDLASFLLIVHGVAKVYFDDFALGFRVIGTGLLG